METSRVRKRLWVSILTLFVLTPIVVGGLHLAYRTWTYAYNATRDDIAMKGDEYFIDITTHSYNGDGTTERRLLRADGTPIFTGNFNIEYADPFEPFLFQWDEHAQAYSSFYRIEQNGAVEHSLPEHFNELFQTPLVSLSRSPDKRFLMIHGQRAIDQGEETTIAIYDEEQHEWFIPDLDELRGMVAALVAGRLTVNPAVDVEWVAHEDHQLFFIVDGVEGGLVQRPDGRPVIAKFTYDVTSRTDGWSAYPVDAPYGPLKVNGPEGILSMFPEPLFIEAVLPRLGKARLLYQNQKTGQTEELLSWFTAFGYHHVYWWSLNKSSELLLVAINGEYGIMDVRTHQFAHLLSVPYVSSFGLTEVGIVFPAPSQK